MQNKIKLSIIGTRGVPARYGGFETFAQEISLRFIENGYQVLVVGDPQIMIIQIMIIL